MSESILGGLRALDLADEKGFVCGKILGALGVDVIKVERPGGDPSRLIPPFYQDTPDPEKSLYWRAYNTDKRGITLNIETEEGRKLFLKLAEKVDFVIESFEPGYLEKLGLGYEALRQVNPGITMVSITPFGQTGPYSRWKASELVIAAMGGLGNNTGDPDRAPVKESMDSTYYHGGVMGALGAMISHYNGQLTGEGQHVDVSLQEATGFRTTSVLLAWELSQMHIKRQGPRQTYGPVSSRWYWDCKDGALFWHMMGGLFGAPQNKALSDWMDEVDPDNNPLSEVKDWTKFDKPRMPQEEWSRWEVKIEEHFKKFTRKELAHESLKRGMNIAICQDPAEVMSFPHLAERGFWEPIEDPALGTTMNYPKFFFLSNETENYVSRPAPAIGADNEEVYGQELGLSGTEIAALKAANVI